MQIIVLLLDNSMGPWTNLYLNGALKTWCVRDKIIAEYKLYKGKKPRFEVVNNFLNFFFVSTLGVKFWKFFVSKSSAENIKCEESQDQIIVNVLEIWPNITLKTVAALEYIEKNYNYDYILRANANCYLNKKILIELLNKYEFAVDYAGPVKKDFIAGWGVLLSRKAVRIIVNSTLKNDLKLFDDEAIGKVLARHNVQAISLPYIEVNNFEYLDTLSKSEFLSTPFFRCKSFVNGRRIDDLVMQVLHSKFEAK